jgi:hypothetical protein
MLRACFRNNKKLLNLLSRCAWECIKKLYAEAAQSKDAVPGAVIAVHTAGEKLNFHVHLHALVSDGVFLPNGDFMLLPLQTDLELLERLFRHKVLSLLIKENRITRLTAERLLTWEHSGFNGYRGERIEADNRESRERLARYIIRAPMSLEKLAYLPEEGKVVYGSRHDRKVFHPLDFLAELTQHIPDHYEHRLLYYGAYSSKSRGLAAKSNDLSADGQGEQEPHLIEPSMGPKSCRKAWAALIRRVYEVDPLLCPRCHNGQMKIVAFIQGDEPVRSILKHLNLWNYPRRAPPKKIPLPIQERLWPKYNHKRRATLPQAADSWEPYAADPETSWDTYCKDPEYQEV